MTSAELTGVLCSHKQYLGLAEHSAFTGSPYLKTCFPIKHNMETCGRISLSEQKQNLSVTLSGVLQMQFFVTYRWRN